MWLSFDESNQWARENIWIKFEEDKYQIGVVRKNKFYPKFDADMSTNDSFKKNVQALTMPAKL